jgi:hypothetical protein
VIGKISVPRGVHVGPLLRYLFGPVRREEHTDPHLVAGWRSSADLEPPLRADGTRDFRRLTGLLKQPLAVLGDHGYARPVWHCALRAAPDDRMLSDAEWAQIAADVMDRTGLAPYGQDDAAVRWVAVRHGEDHIHLVAMLGRQDGSVPSLSFERYRVRAACRAAEQRYGLRSTAPADRTAARRPSRGESEKAARRGRGEPPRVTLRRHVITAAAGAASETEFFTRLETAGVLARKRFSSTVPGQVTGYAVALPGDTAHDGRPVWYGGGKLAPDLTWPKLRQRWAPARTPPSAERMTAHDQQAIWQHAAQVAAEAAEHVRTQAAADPAAAADAAWAASDILHVAAATLGSPGLRQAADSFDRAARAAHGRIPAPSRAGNQLRHAARLIGTLAHITHNPALIPVVLVLRLAALTDAVAELRRVQQHAAQAAAARTTAQQLHAVTGLAPATAPAGHARVRSDGLPADPSFPQPLRHVPRRPPPGRVGHGRGSGTGRPRPGLGARSFRPAEAGTGAAGRPGYGSALRSPAHRPTEQY